MTGFGEAAEQVGDVSYSLELRSLNNRYFKAVIRLPEELSSLESQLEAQLRKRITRGSISVQARIKYPDASSASRVNDQALVAYLDHLEMLHDRVATKDQAITIDLTALLALPGVLKPAFDREELLEDAGKVFSRLADKACDRMLAMRLEEGTALAEELRTHCEGIRERQKQIAQRAPMVVEEYHLRLRSRIDELLGRAQLKIGEPELLREVAIFAERADISEEVSRLDGHLDHLARVIHTDNGEPAGRTLDFLAQEMLREANTIASKSGDALISRLIVEIKGAIDRIKEQVQNVE